MVSNSPHFRDVSRLLQELKPRTPAYCTYPHVYREAARKFLDGFPGRVLYAVKANDDPEIVG